jgi:hypothetical protein
MNIVIWGKKSKSKVLELQALKAYQHNKAILGGEYGDRNDIQHWDISNGASSIFKSSLIGNLSAPLDAAWSN